MKATSFLLIILNCKPVRDALDNYSVFQCLIFSLFYIIPYRPLCHNKTRDSSPSIVFLDNSRIF